MGRRKRQQQQQALLFSAPPPPLYYRPPQTVHKAMDESTDGCARTLQILLLVVTSAAFTLSLFAMGNCEFLYFYMTPLQDMFPNMTTSFNRDDDYEDDGKRSFGLFKFEDPTDPNKCHTYGDELSLIYIPEDLPIQMKIARWGASITTWVSLLALFVLFLEMCCCRFVCSRVMINFSFMIAMGGIPATFALYMQGTCNIFSKSSYACQLGQGAIQILVALVLLFMSLVISCVTPKATPVIRVIQDREKRSARDPCCCCPGRSHLDIYEENPELLLANCLSDEVEVTHGDSKITSTTKKTTTTYKHYMDDQAGGVTLQSQYNAASRHWLQCERNYEEALDRFKRECEDVLQQDGHHHHNDETPRSDWRHMMQLPIEDILDPELARQRRVLETLESTCRQAKRVMDRIESDLEEHIKPPEEKIGAALESIRQSRLQQQQQQSTTARGPEDGGFPSVNVNSPGGKSDETVEIEEDKPFNVSAEEEEEEDKKADNDIHTEEPRAPSVDGTDVSFSVREERTAPRFASVMRDESNTGFSSAMMDFEPPTLLEEDETRFVSAVMNSEDSNIEVFDMPHTPTNEEPPRKSWMSWVFDDVEGGDKYKKMT